MAQKNVNVPVSPTLRAALRDEGWWKLAFAVKSAQGLAPPREPTLQSAVEAIAMKMAADRATDRKIQDGLSALRRLRGVQ